MRSDFVYLWLFLRRWASLYSPAEYITRGWKYLPRVSGIAYFSEAGWVERWHVDLRWEVEFHYCLMLIIWGNQTIPWQRATWEEFYDCRCILLFPTWLTILPHWLRLVRQRLSPRCRQHIIASNLFVICASKPPPRHNRVLSELYLTVVTACRECPSCYSVWLNYGWLWASSPTLSRTAVWRRETTIQSHKKLSGISSWNCEPKSIDKIPEVYPALRCHQQMRSKSSFVLWCRGNSSSVSPRMGCISMGLISIDSRCKLTNISTQVLP